MKIQFKETSNDTYSVTVSRRMFLIIGPWRDRKFLYVRKSAFAEALINQETGQHVFGSIRKKISERFSIWQAGKLGLL